MVQSNLVSRSRRSILIRILLKSKDLIKSILLRMHHRPVEAFLFVTERCNSRCITCHFWRKQQAKELPKEQIFKFVDMLSKFQKYNHFTITGGEPLLRKDIFEIIRYISSKGDYVKLITNGILLSNKTIDSLVQSGLNLLTVSMNALDPNIHDVSRGIKGNLHQILEALDYIKKNYPELELLISTVIYKKNLDQIIPLIKYAEKLSVPIYLQPIQEIYYLENHLDSSNNLKEVLLDDSVDSILALLDKIKSYKLRGYNILTPYSFLREYSRYFKNLRKNRVKKCKIGYFRIRLTIDGNPLLCPKYRPIGTLFESDDFGKVWNSRLARKQRKQMLHCSKECEYFCTLTPKTSDFFIQAFIRIKKLFIKT